MSIRVFWRIVDVNPGDDIEENVQLIYRDQNGFLTSDSTAVYHFDLSKKRSNAQVQDAVAKTDIVILRDINTPIGMESYNLIVLDDERTDEENSKTIADCLGLSPINGVQVCTTYEINPNHRVLALPQNLLINYSVWCELHNKLMINVSNVFGRCFYVCDTNRTDGRARRMLPTYPNDLAISWARNWSVVVSRGGTNNIEIIKSFNKYNVAQKAANKYIRSITGNRRMPAHNFRSGSYNYEDLNISLHKEKDLS